MAIPAQPSGRDLIINNPNPIPKRWGIFVVIWQATRSVMIAAPPNKVQDKSRWGEELRRNPRMTGARLENFTSDRPPARHVPPRVTGTRADGRVGHILRVEPVGIASPIGAEEHQADRDVGVGVGVAPQSILCIGPRDALHHRAVSGQVEERPGQLERWHPRMSGQEEKILTTNDTNNTNQNNKFNSLFSLHFFIRVICVIRG
ncbi:hypothetical protein [Singulisphaera acidiphila]|uniref:Uncharacterized protein n=1 Tax=Singulisphaera acidiphila (strain ATCC BAA-1392 / DSM 18658 / VKM B-2454 / MOB10) TaxID=886293 RepID=L0D815_SINAD|nr:hypothetical protein [Singulisphaera acidiphila]AGA24963.1 hypothetical protein Sinac_0539 [Singulisphaera acidiphila DSM 18658]